FTIGEGREKTKVRYVKEHSELMLFVKARMEYVLRFKDKSVNSGPVYTAVSLDCKTNSDGLQLLGLSTSNQTSYIFDCNKIGEYVVLNILEPILTAEHVLKVMQCPQDHEKNLNEIGEFTLKGILDARSVAHWLHQHPQISLDDLLENPRQATQHTEHFRQETKNEREVGSDRPLPRDQLESAALDIVALQRTTSKLSTILTKMTRVTDETEEASTTRAIDETEAATVDDAPMEDVWKRREEACWNEPMEDIWKQREEDCWNI
ncbi:MAG: hypothetical protein SGARI_003731, partial [Bacillariaceae sp.]